ncbi:type VI secretion system Vgr family protein [Herbaspirillum huttiense]|uniref:type VI secretion system Vgr family protein n=1 Tax=Herbaspirillum huttiense TaxID=863372 RepID=UPI001E2E9A22|nr:type VI secretion system Vgr family protein [Herbaspirillum huttiense]
MTDQFQTIAAAFAGAVLSQQHRPLRLRWRAQETHFAQWLLVQRVDIEEACLEGMQAKLTCVSSDPELPLQALLGQPLGIEMVTDRGGLHHTNGIITEARAGQADGALRVYQLTLKDALSIMEERINTRVFRQLSVPRILEIMLGEWRQRSPALATAFHFDLDGLEDRRYPVREISHQFNESDAHFIRRLCRREGIAWYVASPQPTAETGRTEDADVPMHALVFCDQSALLPRALAGTVRYHRDGATEERDTISAWSRQRSLVPGRVWRGSWDYKAVRVEEAASHSAIDQGDTGRALAAILNDGLIEAPHAADGQQDHLRLGMASCVGPKASSLRHKHRTGGAAACWSARPCWTPCTVWRNWRSA